MKYFGGIMTLREQFFEDTGIDDDPLTYQNDSGEFVIDERYYHWLELKLQNTSSNSDYAKCRKEIMEYFDAHLTWKDCEVEGILKKHFA